MNALLHLDITASSIERARADVAVVWLFDDERPLRDSAGRADWRLCGRLSQLVAAGRLSGAFGEAALVATFGGLAVPWLLVLGAGSRSSFDADAYETIARESTARAGALRAGSLALELPDERLAQAARERRTQALLTGAAAGLASLDHGAEIQLRLLVASEDTTHAAELVRRVRPARIPGGVQLRLPGGPPPATTPAGGSRAIFPPGGRN